MKSSLKFHMMFFSALVFISSMATAQDEFKSIQIAQKLGSLLASELFCDLAFNQEAISNFIENNVSAEDMAFVNHLDGAITLTKFTLDTKSVSEKTAHCAQIRRLAIAYKFVQ